MGSGNVAPAPVSATPWKSPLPELPPLSLLPQAAATSESAMTAPRTASVLLFRTMPFLLRSSDAWVVRRDSKRGVERPARDPSGGGSRLRRRGFSVGLGWGTASNPLPRKPGATDARPARAWCCVESTLPTLDTAVDVIGTGR